MAAGPSAAALTPPVGARLLFLVSHSVVAVTVWLLWAPWPALVYLGLVVLFRAWARRGNSPPRRTLRFTREGKYLVAITLGVGFAAINTGNNLLYLVLGMLLSMIIVSGVLSEQTLRGLRVRRELPRQVFAGRPFLTGIALANKKARLPSFSVQVEDVIDGRPLAKKCYFLKVPAGARQHTSYRAELERRGRYVYEGLLVGTRFPFAFFVKSRRYSERAELLVLPRITPVARLPVEARELLGPVSRPRLGAGREFHGLRDYEVGDDARDIHWKRSAREGRLLLRTYESEASRSVTVVLNTRLPPGAEPPTAEDPRFDDFEATVDLAASLVVHFAQRGLDVELRAGDHQLTVNAGGQGLNAALRALALAEFRATEDDARPLRPARGGGRWLLVTHVDTRAQAQAAAFDHVFERG